ncbi:sulfite exporter TauE/SafE family protein [Clostridium sp.]|uniref:sulfite exporter TauE/SafE family protein n=1 Tax=Clostridium sp. TaxID=1506 RepID=UPI00261B9072|nr:sulfite exporter TauE/SafE family protein [uncultured Clostridium sp.]
MTTLTIVLFCLVIFITHFLGSVTGNGCTVLALPFAIMLTGIKIAKPVLTICGLLLCLYVVLVSYKDIVWKQYFRIMIFAGIGLPIGMWIFNKFPENVLKSILGIFIIVISIKGLINCYKTNKVTKPINNSVLNFIVFIGGCVQGAFTSGGPLVIIYATEKLKNKSNFRSTLCMVWVTLNAIIVVQNFVTGAITPEVTKLLLFTLPFLLLGAILGNYAYHKINDTIFNKMVYIILFISAMFMFL